LLEVKTKRTDKSKPEKGDLLKLGDGGIDEVYTSIHEFAERKRILFEEQLKQ